MSSAPDIDDIFGDDEDELPSSPTPPAGPASPTPPAGAFVEREAEAEDDGAAPEDEEEDGDDDGADLEGFIVPAGESTADTQAAGTQDAGVADARSSDSEDMGSDLEDMQDEDLATLAEAGLDLDMLAPALKAKQAEKASQEEARQAEEARQEEEAAKAAEAAQARTRPREPDLDDDPDAAEDVESLPKRPRTETLVAADPKDLEAQLFGDEDEEGEEPPGNAGASAGRAPAPEPDLFDDDADSMDDFLVEEDQEGAAKRRRRDAAEEAAELDITEEQLSEIVDIFGNTDVLKPVDETAFFESGEADLGLDEAKPPVLPMQTQSQTPLPGETPPGTPMTGPGSPRESPSGSGMTPVSPSALSEASLLHPQTPQAASKKTTAEPPQDGVDPDLKEVIYSLPGDLELEKRDDPERWVQTYMSEPILLGSSGVRRWTDEEEEAETNWIYMEAFWQRWYDRPSTQDYLQKILFQLHTKKLEPQYIMSHNYWQYQQWLTSEDMETIFELDHRWQKVWATYRKLQAWISRLTDQGQAPPQHISKKVSPETWKNKDAEQELTDTWDWLCAMHPDSEEAAQEVKRSHDLQKMAAAIQFGLHEKLGIVEREEGAPLQVFGVTPEQLGKNIEKDMQVHAPDQAREDRIDPVTACQKQVVPNSLLYSAEAVQEVICLYLSRLIAAEPRVRAFVRQKFWEMCAISTKPTRSGKQQSEEASAGFRDSYRAFHVVNRPVKTFLPAPAAEGSQDWREPPPVDTLWLDIVDLHQQGFIELEYSLIEPKQAGKTLADGYRLIMLGYEPDDIMKQKVRMNMHEDRRKDPYYINQIQQAMTEEGAVYAQLQKLKEKLVLVSKANEVVSRLKAAQSKGDNTAKRVAEALFRVAGLQIRHDEDLLSIMTFDPIYEKLMNMYCYIEQQGEREFFVVPTPWNDIRKGILLRTLRDELYPLMWREIQAHLSAVVQKEVCRQAANTLRNIVDMGPYTLTEDELWLAKSKQEDSDDEDDDWRREKEARLAGRCTVLSVVPDITYGVTSDSCVVTVVNEYGEAVVQHVLFRTFYQTPIGDRKPDERDLNRGELFLIAQKKRKDHFEVFKSILKRYKPALIVLPILDESAQAMKDKFEKMLEMDKDFRHIFTVPPQVLFCDSIVPRQVAYHDRLKNEGVYKDCATPQQRIAISAARFVQDPLAETAQLWHEKVEHNALFELNLHRLQHTVPRETLQRALLSPLTSTLAKVGVDVNRIRRAPHLASVLPFACGLGPRKARVFRKCINNVVNSKQMLGNLLAKNLDRVVWEEADKSPVVVNVLPFCRICPTDSADAVVEGIDGFDLTRLPEYQRLYLYEICQRAMRHHALATEDKKLLDELDGVEVENPANQLDQGSDSDSPDSPAVEPDSPMISEDGLDELGNPLLDSAGNQIRIKKAAPKKKLVDKDWILRAMQRYVQFEKDEKNPFEVSLNEGLPVDELKQLVNQSFEQASEKDVSKLRDLLIAEITSPFKDNRTNFEKMDPLVVFYLISGETEDRLRNGSLVTATVVIDMEYGVGKDGAKLDKKEVKCDVMPWGVQGNFRKAWDEVKDKKTGYIEGMDTEFEEGETVSARVIGIKTAIDRRPLIYLSVDKDAELWNANFPIKEQDQAYFVPEMSEDWTKIELGRVGEGDKEKQKRKLKDWVNRPRNIRHPNFLSRSHEDVVQILNRQPLGTALFRSSKRYDTLVALLKVRDTRNEQVDSDLTIRTFEVFEKTADGSAKTHGNSFELAPILEVDGVVYADFDDITARHLDPIMDNLRLFQEHKRFGLSLGMETRVNKVMDVLNNFTKKKPQDLHYAFLMHDKIPGHGMLLWALGGKKVRQELVEIMPEGFSLWGRSHAQLKMLVQWFKEDGWRASHRMRKEWLEEKKKQDEEMKEKRGEDAIGRVPTEKSFTGFNPLSGSGLQTPSNMGLATPGGTRASGTPTVYGFESAAPTPSGLATPQRDGTRTPMGGMQTPGGSFGAPATPKAPGTPFQGQSQAPATPRAPGTPFHGEGGALPATPRAPGTPYHGGQGRLPSTPTNFGFGPRASGTPAGPPPATPAFASGPQAAGTPGMYRASATPAGPPPATPASPGYGYAAAGTPAGPPPATPATGYRHPGTPAGPPPATPSAGYRAAGTPAGPPPATPSPGFYTGPAAGTPAGPPPGTPAVGSGFRAAGTPAGPPPATPSPGYRAAGTPAGPPPATPASPGYGYAAAGTPAGPPPGTPSPGFRAAGTPAGPPPATPASPGYGYRAAGTPAGPPPATPASPGYRAAGTPAGPPPATPLPGYRAAGTPAGPPPATPSPGFRTAGAPTTPNPAGGAKKEEKKDAFDELFD